MQVPRGDDGALAVAFVNTIHHDGHGGVADDFATDDGVGGWLVTMDALPTVAVTPALADELRSLRTATRALFAVAVAPGPPSRADASPRMSATAALGVLEAQVATLRLAHGHAVVGGRITPTRTTAARGQVSGLLAVAALDFLAGDDVDKLRSCQAPRCVRYFVKAHGRQEWCKETCATRARVARHAERKRAEAPVLASFRDSGGAREPRSPAPRPGPDRP